MKNFIIKLSKKPFFASFLFFLVIFISNINFYFPTQLILNNGFQFPLPGNELLLATIISLILAETTRTPLTTRYNAIFSSAYSLYNLAISIVGIFYLSLSPAFVYLFGLRMAQLGQSNNYIMESVNRFFTQANLYILYLFIYTLIKGIAIYLVIIAVNKTYFIINKSTKS